MPKPYHSLKYIPSDGTYCRRSSSLLVTSSAPVNEGLSNSVEQPKDDLERARHAACSRYRPGGISVVVTIANLLMFFLYLCFIRQSLRLLKPASEKNAAVGLESGLFFHLFREILPTGRKTYICP